MFIDFFYHLRERKLDISFNEWMTLLSGLEKGLAGSFTDFYYLCRAVLVKSETEFDKFDGAFLEFFKDVPFKEKLPDELLSWLEKPIQKDEKDFDYERAEQNKYLSREQIMQMFKERLLEQKERHDGGSYWVGTGGVSVFGHSGYSPKGIRVGGESKYQSALEVAGDRKFKDFRSDQTLDTRQFQLAFKSLRQFSSKIDAPKTELDIDETISETSNNAGSLKLVFDRPRKNTVKLMLLIDSGGSMDYYRTLISSLFDAVNKANHFKDLQIFYFHNCVYSKLYTTPILYPTQAVKTEWVLRQFSKDYKIIFVGDASMEPSELFGSSYYDYRDGIRTTGMDWLLKFKETYDKIIWLNPTEKTEYTGAYYRMTYDAIGKEFDMYKLTVENLTKALKKLLISK